MCIFGFWALMRCEHLFLGVELGMFVCVCEIRSATRWILTVRIECLVYWSGGLHADTQRMGRKVGVNKGDHQQVSYGPCKMQDVRVS